MLNVLHDPLELKLHGSELSVPEGNVVTSGGEWRLGWMLDTAGFLLGSWWCDRRVWRWRWWNDLWVRRLQASQVRKVGLWGGVAQDLFWMRRIIRGWRRRHGKISLEQGIYQGLVLLSHAVDAIGELDEILWRLVWVGRVGLVVSSIVVRSHGSSRDHTP